jgi:4-hydroxybenzoate polyprenyltransferase
MLMTAIGILISGHLYRIGTIQLDVFSLFSEPLFFQIFTGNIAMFLLSLLTIAFIWQYAVMINHVYDSSIDKMDNADRLIPSGLMNSNQVKKIAIVDAFVALGLGFIIGPWSFLLVIIGLFFGTIYSVPPIRIRDSIFSTTIIGIGSTIAFLLGYYAPSFVKVMYGENAGNIMRIYPDLTMESAIIGFLIFIALTIGPLIKDYKDYEGDKKAGVKNLFTIYGLEKGVTITSILLPIPFLCLLLLFHNVIDIIILIPAGILAGISFKKLKDTRIVFGIYFPVILYCLLRWLEIISF